MNNPEMEFIVEKKIRDNLAEQYKTGYFAIVYTIFVDKTKEKKKYDKKVNE